MTTLSERFNEYASRAQTALEPFIASAQTYVKEHPVTMGAGTTVFAASGAACFFPWQTFAALSTTAGLAYMLRGKYRAEYESLIGRLAEETTGIRGRVFGIYEQVIQNPYVENLNAWVAEHPYHAAGVTGAAAIGCSWYAPFSILVGVAAGHLATRARDRYEAENRNFAENQT